MPFVVKQRRDLNDLNVYMHMCNSVMVKRHAFCCKAGPKWGNLKRFVCAFKCTCESFIFVLEW